MVELRILESENSKGINEKERVLKLLKTCARFEDIEAIFDLIIIFK